MSVEKKNSIMIVDDEAFNLDIMQHLLKENGKDIVAFTDPEAAYNTLIGSEEKYSLVILDRMMPGLNGIDFLRNMRKSGDLYKIPVLMQSARPLESELSDELADEHFIYMIKPYKKDDFVEKVNSLLSTSLAIARNDKKEVASYKFTLQSHSEIESILLSMAALLPSLDSVASTLKNLLENGIEHGNLGIGFRLKTKLLEIDAFHTEVEKRLQSIEYSEKKVYVNFVLSSNKCTIQIRDEGNGFNWKDFFSEYSLKHKGFSNISYNDKGNIVTCTMILDNKDVLPSLSVQKNVGW